MVVNYLDASKSHELDRVLYQVEPAGLDTNPYPFFKKICAELKQPFGTGYISADNFKIIGKQPTGELLTGKLCGGRATTIDKTVDIEGQEFKINVKGSSARFDGKDDIVVNYFNIERIEDKNQRELLIKELKEKGFIDVIASNHCWSNTPYGGQNQEYSCNALKLSDAVFSDILKMHICPVLMVPGLDEGHIIDCGSFGRYQGKYSQDIRLIPSNVRLEPVPFDAGVYGLSKEIFRDIKVSKEEFKKNIMTSIIQSLCLPFNTIKEDGRKTSAYFYNGVNPKKDSAIAGNGVAYFSDLEGVRLQQKLLEKMPIPDTIIAIERDIDDLAKCLSSVFSEDKKDFLKDNIGIVEEILPDNLYISETDSQNRIYLWTSLL